MLAGRHSRGLTARTQVSTRTASPAGRAVVHDPGSTTRTATATTWPSCRPTHRPRRCSRATSCRAEEPHLQRAGPEGGDVPLPLPGAPQPHERGLHRRHPPPRSCSRPAPAPAPARPESRPRRPRRPCRWAPTTRPPCPPRPPEGRGAMPPRPAPGPEGRRGGHPGTGRHLRRATNRLEAGTEPLPQPAAFGPPPAAAPASCSPSAASRWSAAPGGPSLTGQ